VSEGVSEGAGRLFITREPCGTLIIIIVIYCRLERRHAGEGEDGKGANILMAKALQQCPNSGFLWSEEIVTSPRADQKRKSMDAIKNCPDDSNVIAAVAGLFSREGKVSDGRHWPIIIATLTN
tara:strand:+ start:40 stop:408 length:369 start_codon:yes stop_codon:yes gene_type:complete